MEWERVRPSKEKDDPCLQSQSSVRGGRKPSDCKKDKKSNAGGSEQKKKSLLELAQQQRAKAEESERADSELMEALAQENLGAS